MKLKTFLLINIISLVIFIIPIQASNNFKIVIDMNLDSSNFGIMEPDLNEINIKILPLESYKKYEIAPILASRSGIEFNLILSGKQSEIKFLNEENNIKKVKNELNNYSYSLLSIKFLSGKNGIPKYDFITKDPYQNANTTYKGEKTKYSFALGLKNKDLFNIKNKNIKNSGLVAGLGFIFEENTHHYQSGILNFGYNDNDVHFYFEVEPLLENEYISGGINYNTYFHQFSLRLGMKF